MNKVSSELVLERLDRFRRRLTGPGRCVTYAENRYSRDEREEDKQR
jgi:hypothetical protein